MAAALWHEIQDRYGFVAPDPFDPAAFTNPRAGFWLATADGQPVGSIAMTPLDETTGELDVMYVAPDWRGRDVAQSLLAALEEHMRNHGFTEVRLRAGEAQPEAVRFYKKSGFARIPAFGKWVSDETAWCFGKRL